MCINEYFFVLLYKFLMCNTDFIISDIFVDTRAKKVWHSGQTMMIDEGPFAEIKVDVQYEPAQLRGKKQLA